MTVYLDEIVYLHCHQQRECPHLKCVIVSGAKVSIITVVLLAVDREAPLCLFKCDDIRCPRGAI